MSAADEENPFEPSQVPAPDPGTGPVNVPPPFTAGGQVPGEFEGTRIDLGEDLLEKTAIIQLPGAPAESPAPAAEAQAVPEVETLPALNTPEEISDQLESAKILMNEGLVEEAKKILRRILLVDQRNSQARHRLDEIHEIELKQIFSEHQPLRRRRREPELDLSYVNSEAIMRQLDRDLKLGVFAEGDAGEALATVLSLFQSREGMEEFGQRMDKLLAGSGWRDRLDMGIAFLEMGLHDLAARQFKAAGRDADHILKTTGLHAYALILAGRPFEATLVLEPMLGDADIPAHEKIDFMYLMGRAYERLQKPEVAAHWFQQALEFDPHYRDTEQRLKFLRAPARTR